MKKTKIASVLTMSMVRNLPKKVDRAQCPNPYLRRKIATHVRLNDFSWILWNKFPNMSEYELKKVDKVTAELLDLSRDKGEALRNSFGNVEFYLNRAQDQKNSSLLRMSKNRVIIYCAAGVFERRKTQQWRSRLTSSGWIYFLYSDYIRQLTPLGLQNLAQHSGAKVPELPIKQ